MSSTAKPLNASASASMIDSSLLLSFVPLPVRPPSTRELIGRDSELVAFSPGRAPTPLALAGAALLLQPAPARGLGRAGRAAPAGHPPRRRGPSGPAPQGQLPGAPLAAGG